LAYHLSLEDPLLKLFVTEFVQRILGSLGMKEDEPKAAWSVGESRQHNRRSNPLRNGIVEALCADVLSYTMDSD